MLKSIFESSACRLQVGLPSIASPILHRKNVQCAIPRDCRKVFARSSAEIIAAE
jgi:hypothetical protein